MTFDNIFSIKYNLYYLGLPWKKIKFYDINAMYPSCFREDMPCGRGFEWEQNDGYFTKKLMTNKKISLVSVQWLGYMEHDERFIDRDGNRCKIITGWNSEEVKVGKYSIDGFCEVDGIKYALEFDGCRWHGCDRCGQPPVTYENVVRKMRYKLP